MKTLLALVPLLALALTGCGSKDDATVQAVKAVAPPAGHDWTQTVSRTPEGFVMGNPAAPIKLVEYGSRLCPTCGALARDGYQPLTDTYVKSGKVSFEFREFLVHGPIDLPPALLGTCVGPEPFFPLLEQMFTNQESFEDKLQHSPPPVLQAIDAAPPATRFKLMGEAMGLVDFVQQRGVPADKAAACLTNTAEIDRLTKQTQARGPAPTGDGTVSGTPALLINGRGLGTTVITWPALQAALKQAGA